MWFGVFRLFLFFSLFCYFTKAIQMYCKKKIKKSVILQRRITKYSFQAFWRKLKWNMINNFASLYKTASTLQVWINVELLCCDEEQGLLNPEVFNLIHSRFSWESISSTQLFPLQVGSWILCAKKAIIWVEKKKKKSLGKSWNDFQLPLLSENKEEAPHHLSRQISMHHQVLCRVPVSHDELGHTFSWRGCNAAAEVKSLVHTPVLL